jgi:hypothetical protein
MTKFLCEAKMRRCIQLSRFVWFVTVALGALLIAHSNVRADETQIAWIDCSSLNSRWDELTKTLYVKELNTTQVEAHFALVTYDEPPLHAEEVWAPNAWFKWDLDPYYYDAVDLNPAGETASDSTTFFAYPPGNNGSCCYLLSCEFWGSGFGEDPHETQVCYINVEFTDVIVTFAKSELRPGISNTAVTRYDSVDVTVARADTAGNLQIPFQTYPTNRCDIWGPTSSITVPAGYSSWTDTIEVYGIIPSDNEGDGSLIASTGDSIPVTVTCPTTWKDDAWGPNGKSDVLHWSQAFVTNGVTFYGCYFGVNVVFEIVDQFPNDPHDLGAAWQGAEVTEYVKPNGPWVSMDKIDSPTVLDDSGHVTDYCRHSGYCGVFSQNQIPPAPPAGGASVDISHQVDGIDIGPDTHRDVVITPGPGNSLSGSTYRVTDSYVVQNGG